MEEHIPDHKLVCGMNALKLRHQNAKNASRPLCIFVRCAQLRNAGCRASLSLEFYVSVT
jgi:hypothetical protein